MQVTCNPAGVRSLARKAIRPAYVFFYILFLPDTWRVLMGAGVAYLLVPTILPPDIDLAGRMVIYIMCATIGYAVSGIPGNAISRLLKRLVLGDRPK